MKKGFVMVPIALARDKSLSGCARHLWTVIRSYGDADGSKCFPGTDKLADEMKCDRKSVFRWLQELEDAHYLWRDKTRKKGAFLTNTYTLHNVPTPRPRYEDTDALE